MDRFSPENFQQISAIHSHNTEVLMPIAFCLMPLRYWRFYWKQNTFYAHLRLGCSTLSLPAWFPLVSPVAPSCPLSTALAPRFVRSLTSFWSVKGFIRGKKNCHASCYKQHDPHGILLIITCMQSCTFGLLLVRPLVHNVTDLKTEI